MSIIAKNKPGPFEVVLLCLIFIARVVGLLEDGPPGFVERAVGYEIFVAWSAMMLIGAPVTLLGIVWRGKRNTSLFIEQTGLILVAGASLMYAAILFTRREQADGTFLTSAFVAGYGIAAIWRSFQIFQIHRSSARRSELSAGGDT